MAKAKKPASAPKKKTTAAKSAKPAAKKPAAAKPAAKSAKPATKAAAKPATRAAAAAKPAAPEKKMPAKKPAVKKPAAKPMQPTGTPLIDTNLVAQNAAAMLLNRDVLESATPPAAPAAAAQPAQPQQAGAAPAKESAAFKNLKDQLAKPKPAALSSLFGPTGQQKKTGGNPFDLHQQKGHAQTFGGINKAGVPRRTNG
ncbi:MAG TPA: hypothetical protein VH475_00430 [Tepidisphaeraceae bacterium]|jgi:hypothetical protein